MIVGLTLSGLGTIEVNKNADITRNTLRMFINIQRGLTSSSG